MCSKLFAEKDYIRRGLMQTLFVDGEQLVTSVRNNMKNSLMTMSGKILHRKRSVLETVNDELKSSCQIEHSRHRSFGDFFANISTGLSS